MYAGHSHWQNDIVGIVGTVLSMILEYGIVGMIVGIAGWHCWRWTACVRYYTIISPYDISPYCVYSTRPDFEDAGS